MKTIRATVDHFGRAELRFGYDKTLVDLVKSVSGFAWDKTKKIWWGPVHALAALEFAGRTAGAQLAVEWPRQAPSVISGGNRELRNYQMWAAGQLLSNGSYLLAWAPRVGKTSCALAAGASGIASRMFERLFVFAPANVLHVWREQLIEMFPRLPHATLDGVVNVVAEKPKTAKEKDLRELMKQETRVRSARVIFCQHDLLARRAKDLLALAEQGLFAVACDEPQGFVDFKAPRSVLLMDIAQSKNCFRRWALSGTPMRNAAEDLAVTFEFLGCPTPQGTEKKRSPWSYLIRYAGAHEDEIAMGDGSKKAIWKCADFETNGDELQAKLWSVGHRLTREEVAPWLPKAERSVFLANLSKDAASRYRAMEGILGARAMAAVNGGERLEQLRALAASVLGPKLDTVIERLVFHADHRGVKVVAGMMFHESLDQLGRKMFPQVSGVVKPVLRSPVFLAAGWDLPEKRAQVIQAWKDHQGPAVLLCNIISSSVGIDLADAEVQVNGELPWVPSDALQWEARLQDVHQGKRRAPPLHEYVLAKGTIDEDMALAMLQKMGAISRIVGSEREMAGLDDALRQSGLVSTVDLGLRDHSETAIEAALDGMRRRLLGLPDDLAGVAAVMSAPTATLSTADLVGAIEEAFEDEEPDLNEAEGP